MRRLKRSTWLFGIVVVVLAVLVGWLIGVSLAAQNRLDVQRDKIDKVQEALNYSNANEKKLYDQVLKSGQQPVVTPSDPGAKPKNGDDGAKGDKGDPGADSVVPGPQGVPGIAGPAGPPGADSTVPGPQGIPGVDGKNGADSTVPGPQGDPGPQGPAGESIQGPAGTNGVDGAPGTSVTGTTYACTGPDLIITTTYSNDTSESSTIAASPACPII